MRRRVMECPLASTEVNFHDNVSASAPTLYIDDMRLTALSQLANSANRVNSIPLSLFVMLDFSSDFWPLLWLVVCVRCLCLHVRSDPRHLIGGLNLAPYTEGGSSIA